MNLKYFFLPYFCTKLKIIINPKTTKLPKSNSYKINFRLKKIGSSTDANKAPVEIQAKQMCIGKFQKMNICM